MSFTTLGYVALVPLFALAFIGAVTVTWVIRAAVRGWQRVPPRIRHGRIPLQPVEPIDTGQEPPGRGSWREAAIDEALARILAEGDKHNG